MQMTAKRAHLPGSWKAARSAVARAKFEPPSHIQVSAFFIEGWRTALVFQQFDVTLDKGLNQIIIVNYTSLKHVSAV